MDTNQTITENTDIDYHKRFITVMTAVIVVVLLILGFTLGYLFRDNFVIQHASALTSSR